MYCSMVLNVISSRNCIVLPKTLHLLDALRSCAEKYGHKLAIVSGEGPITPMQILRMVEDEHILTPDIVEHIPAGEDGAYSALMLIRSKIGIPCEEWLVFAGDNTLETSALRAGAVTIRLKGKLLTPEILRHGLDTFGMKQLEERGF